MHILIRYLFIASFIVFSFDVKALSKAAIATAHPLATDVGEEILRTGGNAFDVAVAVTAMLAVVEPYGSGLGGGGFWLLSRNSNKHQIMIDGRERAPMMIRPTDYLDKNGQLDRNISLNSHLSAGIPGIPAGIIYLHQNFCKLPLETLLAPAIYYAKIGFPVTHRYQNMAKFRLETLRAYPNTAKIFLKDNDVPPLGHLIIQHDLANSLERLVHQGMSGFYQGITAKRLLASAKYHGGVWNHHDLKTYEVGLREPIRIDYHNIRVTSAALPSSGGIVLAQALKILEHFELEKMPVFQQKHFIIEAMRRAYRDRIVYLGDPDYIDVPTARLLDKDYIAGLAMTIQPDKADISLPISDTNIKGTQTTHFSVHDSKGNQVAATLSINFPFGSGLVVEGTGILLNNEMDDFALQLATENAYGLIGLSANSVAPGKRPLSSMTPTFLENENCTATLGTPGGSRIISMVLLAILDFMDGNLPESWVNIKRYHHQYLPDFVQFEPGTLTPLEQMQLQKLGHKLLERSRPYGNMQAILSCPNKGMLFAASDGRGEGEARVIYLD